MAALSRRVLVTQRRRQTTAVAALTLVAAAAAFLASAIAGNDDEAVVVVEPPPTTVAVDELPTGWTAVNLEVGGQETAVIAVAIDSGAFVWLEDRAYLVAPDASVRPLSAPPRSAPSKAAVAWTGEEVIVVGGRPSGAKAVASTHEGWAYRPSTDHWRRLDAAISGRQPLGYAWTGREVLIAGSVVPADGPQEVVAYEPSTGRWRTLADVPEPLIPLASPPGGAGKETRLEGGSAWTGRDLVVVAGVLGSTDNDPVAGAVAIAYNVDTNAWRQLPDPGLSPQATAVAWDGTGVVAWDYLLEARRWSPGKGTWEDLPDLPLRPRECYPSAATDSRNVIFAAYCDQAAVFEGGVWRAVEMPSGEHDFGIAHVVSVGPGRFLVLGRRTAIVELARASAR